MVPFSWTGHFAEHYISVPTGVRIESSMSQTGLRKTSRRLALTTAPGALTLPTDDY